MEAKVKEEAFYNQEFPTASVSGKIVFQSNRDGAFGEIWILENGNIRKILSGRKTAVADHYIYFGNTRNYDEIEDPEQRALQREYDELVNDFMARLILASKNKTERTRFFINNSQYLVEFSPGYYKYYPLGKPQ